MEVYFFYILNKLLQKTNHSPTSYLSHFIGVVQCLIILTKFTTFTNIDDRNQKILPQLTYIFF